ncbi:8031_t:CDS:10 [Diversispora eburnea]|uniref:alpha-1,2-Mannosidase n=1 Tax=Diversispora eburnea TaxID=1213867 RepID=A0A9N8VTJ8_9GLOM|nr:8031_t:CDS:10 [Diversispora eburnea]
MNFIKLRLISPFFWLRNRILRTIIFIVILELLVYQLLNSNYHINRQIKIQYEFNNIIETTQEKVIREKRRDSIKNGFLHAWRGYSKYAWGYDELCPVSNTSRNKFNGWGATIIDSLDTLWIMDLKDEFNKSREFVKTLNFTSSDYQSNVFETVIRYLGGLLSSFELSGEPIFLEKAKELGEALLPSFDTPTRLPYNFVHLNPDKRIDKPPNGGGFLAEVGSSCLEFTKLAKLTGEDEYFYIVNNITNTIFNAKKPIPGLFPSRINQKQVSFGAMGDSFFEYLLKEHILLSGSSDQYRNMYIESIEGMYKYLIKPSPVKERPDLLFLGELQFYDEFIGKMGHLSCFVPGMLAMGSKVFDRPEDLKIAKRLVETCYWSYGITKTGIAAEELWFKIVEKYYHEEEKNEDNFNSDLPDGIDQLSPRYYILRPETIESLFILYRITGDKQYQEKEKWCKTPSGYSGLFNVNTKEVIQNDSMESFFLAETLKYLYLLFSPPDLISLDTYVFNTEAHPIRRIVYFLNSGVITYAKSLANEGEGYGVQYVYHKGQYYDSYAKGMNYVKFHCAFDNKTKALEFASELSDGKDSKAEYVCHSGKLFDQKANDGSYGRIAE